MSEEWTVVCVCECDLGGWEGGYDHPWIEVAHVVADSESQAVDEAHRFVHETSERLRGARGGDVRVCAVVRGDHAVAIEF